MSSIRLYVLDAVDRGGEMHGYELRAQAERERVSRWTDISASAIYGAINRLVGEGLLHVVRTERNGRRPVRQVFDLTDAGREVLAELRRDEVRAVRVRSDPFDLALTRPDPTRLDAYEDDVRSRLDTLRQLLEEQRTFERDAAPYLTHAEVWAVGHRTHLLLAEIDWHERLISALPAILLDHTALTPGSDAAAHDQ